jgi:membrane protein YdbS with pleckstrin-like domain
MTVKREFGVDNELKTLYRTYLALALFGCILSWIIPLLIALATIITEPMIQTIMILSAFLPLTVTSVCVFYWISMFCTSIHYVLDEDKITVVRGVWWKTTSYVPYNRITNINIYQGPISRRLGLGKLAIQTAGFSSGGGSNVKTAEAVIVGIKNFEETKNLIMEFVRGRKPEATETEVEASRPDEVNRQILQELQKIRKSLEK